MGGGWVMWWVGGGWVGGGWVGGWGEEREGVKAQETSSEFFSSYVSEMLFPAFLDSLE